MSQYTNHFLSIVILRLDFSTPITKINEALDPVLEAKCKEYLPILEKRKMEFEFGVTKSPVEKPKGLSKQTVSEWHFFNINKTKELIFGENYIIFNYKEYSNFDDFKDVFSNVIDEFNKRYPETPIKRIGLRYIDRITLLADRTIKKSWYGFWKKYINTDLLHGLKFLDEEKLLARYMNSIEANYERCMVKFRYGIFNEDYPTPNIKKIFILDADVYSTGTYQNSDVSELLGLFHDKASSLFESAIKPALRKKMGVLEYHD